ncbi:hypothetical protein CU309_08750 [Prochlorococcus marinus str. MU1405]|nr:hypothetical protein [Prochlorococcus marinus XMU1405]MBW3040929.1 hypothetical protein [Prochlorococcus marinus str. MU1405]MBW3048389.1 hypothetical protein [Prochlorococcus marinus str. MU1406]
MPSETSLPTAVNAESHWLIIQITKGGGYNSIEKIEMASAEACEKEGRRWENSLTQGCRSDNRRFHCIVGK